jgi:hypothetical protein
VKLTIHLHLRGPFKKFVDSPYYSESERCGGAVTVSFEVPPVASDALLATLHPLLENVLQTVDLLEISCLGAQNAQKSHWATFGPYGGCSNGVLPIHFLQTEHRIQFRSCPMRFLGFSNHEKGTPRRGISKWSTVCSTFARSGWSVLSASLAKGGTSKKKRPSPHLHKVPTRSNKRVHELFKRPSQMCSAQYPCKGTRRKEEVEVQLKWFLTSAVDRDQLHAPAALSRCLFDRLRGAHSRSGRPHYSSKIHSNIIFPTTPRLGGAFPLGVITWVHELCKRPS